MAKQAWEITIENFKRELANSTLTKTKAREFDRWRNGKKCIGEAKEAADALWAEFEKLGDKAVVQINYSLERNAPRPGRPGGGQHRGQGGRGSQQPKRAANANAAAASVLGSPFHNPYTFIPFPAEAPRRARPTPLTIDEDPAGHDRFTGVLDLTVRALRPLLTCEGTPTPETAAKGVHKAYRALTLGDDVIVPATGVRGSLRTLMTVLTGGTLGYVDDELWLCQGRDARLGPAGQRSPAGTPERTFLARVETPGSATRAGTVQLGETKLVAASEFENLRGQGWIERCRPQAGKKIIGVHARLGDDGRLVSVSDGDDDPGDHPWLVKLSGRPINWKGKREGLLRLDGRFLELPPNFWAAYSGRNRHGDHPELKRGDLVWLEPARPDQVHIRSAADVRSIQWARWGREGENLLDVIRQRHPAVLPDCFNADGMVDEVTDLFGQVPMDGETGAAGPFAARVRPENLVFRDAARGGLDERVTLAPLAQPHPGCAAFYRDQPDPDRVRNREDGLRGYKVYRVALDGETPWLYREQGVYQDRGDLKRPEQQRVNKTCDLLKAGREGRLRIAVRALSARELALLLTACAVDWRLGGGKPLGLGLCRVVRADLIAEDGTRRPVFRRDTDTVADIPEPWVSEIDERVRERVRTWTATQTPVANMRYPRSVDSNRNRIQRGGHAWFQRHAQPSKTGDAVPQGLQVLHAGGDLRDRVGADSVRAQPLPPFRPDAPGGDELYGYDCIVPEENRNTGRDKRTLVSRIEPFEPDRHVTGGERSGGHHGQNRQTRQDQRRRR